MTGVQTCALPISERIRKREGGIPAEVLAFTKKRDGLDRERYLSIYGIDNDRFDFADLVINTERMSPECIVDVIQAAITGIAKSNQTVVGTDTNGG